MRNKIKILIHQIPYYYLFLFLPSIFYLISYLFADSTFVSSHFGPSWDNIQALERFFDKNYLMNDFFTNSSSENTPRKIFVYLIAFITSILYKDYLYTLYFLKIFITILFPFFVMLFFTDRFQIFCENRKHYVIFTALFALCVIIANSKIIVEYSLAAWSPLPLWPTSQSLALVLGFASGYFLNHNKKIGLVLFFCASLIHFTNTVFITVIIIIFSNNFKEMLRISVYLLLILLITFILLILFFSSGYKLPAREFIEYYIMQPYIHTHHYRPGWLAPYSILKWQGIFNIYNILIILGVFFSLLHKQYKLAFTYFIFGLCYYLSITLHNFFIDIFPNRYIAALGLTRFTQFGYFMISALLVFYIAKFLCHSRMLKDYLKIDTNLYTIPISNKFIIYFMMCIILT